MTNKLTHKQAYEIVRDNTTWACIYPQDVKFKYGWIFHRTRAVSYTHLTLPTICSV